jgi:putative SOS response-associated peptidase YedK
MEILNPLSIVHNRSPLLVDEKIRELWVSDIPSEDIYLEILDYSYSDIEFYKVDRAVSNPRNNNESLIKKYEEVPF